MTRARLLRFFVVLATLVAAVPGVVRPAAAQSPQYTVFTNLTLFDGTGAPALDDAVLVVQQGRIVAAGARGAVSVPANASVVDLGGTHVIPGLINAHGHVADDTLARLSTYAQAGVTTVLSLGGEDASHAALRDSQDPARPAMARLLIAGPIQEQLDGTAEAIAGIEALRELNVDWVKVRVRDNDMPEPVARVLMDTAHRGGLEVAAHIYTLAEARTLLRAGLDVVAHSVRDREVDDELLGLMQDNQACLVPTLTRELSTYVYAERPPFFEDPLFRRLADADEVEALESAEVQARYARNADRGRSDLVMAQRNLAAIHGAGLRVAMGTDSGASQGRFVGYFEHLELELMVQAGLTPSEALVAATGDAADCLNLQGVGTLVPGNWADFLVLEQNPVQDITNSRSLREVWMAGQRL